MQATRNNGLHRIFALFRPSLETGLTRLGQQYALWLPIAFGFGALGYFASPVEPSFLGLLAVFIAFLVPLLAYSRVEAENFTTLSLHLALLFVLWGMAGALYCQAHVTANATPMLSRDIGWKNVEGTIQKIDPLPEAETRLVLDDLTIESLAPVDTPRRIRITLKKPGDQIYLPGQRVTLLAQIHAPTLPATFGAYDFQRHHFLQGVGALGFAVKPPVIVAQPDVNGVSEHLSVLRTHLQARVEQLLPPAPAGIVTALLTGAQTGITEDIIDTYRKSGLAHALSVSGMHIGMIAGAVFFIVRLGLVICVPRAGLFWPVKKIAAFTGLLAALFYTMLVGPLLPAWRSMIMTALILLAVMLDRLAISLRTLSIAALVLLLLYPEGVVSIGFQLSFLAVFALVAVYSNLRDVLPGWGENWPPFLRLVALWLGGTLLTGLVATLATAPLILAHFQQLPLYGALANALATPLLSFITMPLVIVVLVAYPFGLADGPIKWLGTSVDWLNTLAASVADLPDAVWLVPVGSAIATALLLAGVICLCLARRKPVWAVGLICIGLAVCCWPLRDRPVAYIYPPGDVALVQLQNEEWLRTSRYGQFVTEQWLKREGVPPEEARRLPRKQEQMEGVVCDKAACRVVTRGGVKISLVWQAFAAPEECAWADILITKANLGRICPAKQVDRYRLQREGAATVEVQSGKAVILTQKAQEGTPRHWRRYPWSSDRYRGDDRDRD